MGGKQELCTICIDGTVLNHFNQTPGKQRMHAALNFIHNEQGAVVESLQPAADPGKEPLRSGGFLFHKQLEMFRVAIIINHSVGGGNHGFPFLAGNRLNGHIGDAQIGKQHFS